jgi:hypothetical protein
LSAELQQAFRHLALVGVAGAFTAAEPVRRSSRHLTVNTYLIGGE